MKVVVDTNVLVSGLLSPYGASAEIVTLVSSGVLILCYDARILVEYKEVVARPKFQFDQEKISKLFSFIEVTGEIVAGRPLKVHLSDASDEMFLEVALASRVSFLITGNIKHFPVNKREGIMVGTPQEFLNYFRKG